MSVTIPPDKIESLPFRIKKFDYNRYYIDHPTIKGILNVGNIVNNVGKVPDSLIPPDKMPSEGMVVGLSFQAIVSFTNQGDKHTASKELPTPQKVVKMKKQELTSYIVEEENYEPWNQYVLVGEPPKLLKTRTILIKVEWIIDCYNNLGDPYLLVNHNTSHSVSDTDSPESGMR